MYKYKVKVKKGLDKRTLEKLKKNIVDALMDIMQTSAGPIIIERIMARYDDLAADTDVPEDPTSLGNWRTDFREKLMDELRSVFRSERGIRILLGDKDFMGYDQEIDPEEAEPIKWMVFYLEGLAGRWGFISKEFLESVRGSANVQGRIGRFGAGFLISESDYIEAGFDRIQPFSEVEHPLSAAPPVDIFRDSIKGFDFKPYVKKAIKVALDKALR